MLRRLGLELARGADVRHQREVDEYRPLLPDLYPHLPDRLEKRQRFDIADGAADLDEAHVGVTGALHDARLDLVGNVRNDLDGVAEILSAPFLAPGHSSRLGRW